MVPCENAPIHIYTRQGHRSKSLDNVEAFLSPRWGGVVLLNPEAEICEASQENEPVKINPNSVTVMGVFLAQLRLLLGIPDPVSALLP